jgi:hypothetical protein
MKASAVINDRRRTLRGVRCYARIAVPFGRMQNGGGGVWVMLPIVGGGNKSKLATEESRAPCHQTFTKEGVICFFTFKN